MEPLDTLLINAEEINNWIASAPDTTAFQTNNEVMQYTVELMNRALYLLRIGAQLAPNPDTALRGFPKHRAIIVGHMVRMAKLYEGLLMHICGMQLELAAVF